MRNQIQVKPSVNRLIQFLSLIEEGKFKIPTFQRDFVWENKEKIELFDSISKEYPIGSILLWQPKETFKNKPEIGPYRIDNSNNKDYFYILDGFQRLSTLFGCLTNPHKTKLTFDLAKLNKSYTLYYDIEEESFNMNSNGPITNIPVYVLIDTYEFLDYCDLLRAEINQNDLSKKLVERAKKISSTLIDYQIPSIEIFGGSIKDAVDIFSRINSKGITISQDWMLSALTSNEEEDFNLGEILGKLISDLKEFNFETVRRDTLVQCIASSFGKAYFDQKIEDLASREDFKSVSYKTIEGIKRAVRFLFEELLVIDRRLLPYNNQLVFLTTFFNEVESPSEVQVKKLKEWFWTTTYSNYFTIYSLSKIRHAFEQFKRFIFDENESPIYYDKPNQRFSVADLPNSVSAKSVRSTAFVLFLLNYSNNFNKVSSGEIDTFKLLYLFSGVSSHGNAIPIIQHIDKSKDGLPFGYEKQKDLSYLLNELDFNDNLTKHFLNDTLIGLYNENHGGKSDLILNYRLGLIEQTEKEFVERLNIIYNE
jgi:hypothetical protein